MKELKNCYLIDSLENIGAYASLGGNFAKACEFLARGDFAALQPGKNVIDGERVFVNNVEAQYVLPEERRPELHRRYFDIHVPLSCDEKIGLALFDENAKGDFNEAEDGGLYDQPVEWFTVRKGEFCITWPKTCAHAPAVTTDVAKKAKKLIVKVASGL